MELLSRIETTTRKNTMYEKPKLNHVGDAQDVILGVIQSGDDIDTNYVPGPGGNEWEPEYDGQ
jgi:hypothetical protein